MVKKSLLIVVSLASPVILFFGIHVIREIWIGVDQNAKLNAEMQRATEALSRMGTPGKFYTKRRGPKGVYNRLELGAVGDTVNDTNIKNLEGLTAVVGLDLSDTRISNAALSSISGLTDLEYLQLSRTIIDDEGLKDLVGLINLEALDLSGTRVTQEGAKYLERLPKLKIICAAGTELTRVNGVEVECSKYPESWCGIKSRMEWSSKGWSLACLPRYEVEVTGKDE